MDVTKFTPRQMNALREVFRAGNPLMLLMWKLGWGRLINMWPSGVGRILVIKHRGRKSGKERLTPVNYALVDGEIYCTAGFGSGSDWYRNLQACPTVELWLPEGRGPATAEDISDSPSRLFLLRQVLIASGFAAPLFGLRPDRLSDAELAKVTAGYRLLQLKRVG